MHIELVGDINDIDESAWNALVPRGGFYASHGWTRRHVALSRLKTAYVCIQSGSRLVAVAQVSVARRELSHEYSQQRFAETFGENATYAVLGSRRGYRNPWLMHPDLIAEERRNVVSNLVDTSLELAADWNVDAVVAPYLTVSAMDLLVHEPRLREHREVAGEAVLCLSFGSFDDYVAMMDKKRRWNVLRERARPQALGMRLRVEPVRPDNVDALAGLMVQVEMKYGRQLTIEGFRRYLAATFASDTERARLFTCRTAEGSLVCAAMAFEWKGALYLRATGTDYAAARDSFAHFNVMYYEPIEYSLLRGLNRIYFGTETLQAKVARGCQVRPLFHALLRA